MPRFKPGNWRADCLLAKSKCFAERRITMNIMRLERWVMPYVVPSLSLAYLLQYLDFVYSCIRIVYWLSQLRWTCNHLYSGKDHWEAYIPLILFTLAEFYIGKIGRFQSFPPNRSTETNYMESMALCYNEIPSRYFWYCMLFPNIVFFHFWM